MVSHIFEAVNGCLSVDIVLSDRIMELAERRDFEIINQNADSLNAEALDVLAYQFDNLSSM